MQIRDFNEFGEHCGPLVLTDRPKKGFGEHCGPLVLTRFEILKNMTTFAKRPANIDKRFDPIFETCKQNKLDILEKEQYFNAMITEHEKQGIAAAYKEEGLREGYDKGMEVGMEKGKEKGKLEDARTMKTLGYAAIDIHKVTGLSLEVIEGLQTL